MNHWKKLAALLLAALMTSAAWAHPPRARVGVYVGPYWGPWWGPAPIYYPQPVVVVRPETPPVYVEQADTSEAPPPSKPAAAALAPAPAQQYWYYCASVKGYYPYVKECPEGWQKVLPTPEK